MFQPRLETGIAPPITFSGGTQEASPVFHLEEGLAIFEMKHNGSTDFYLQLINYRGEKAISLSIGKWESRGSTAIHIARSGPHILNVEADSDWVVRITQPAPDVQLEPPITLRGFGRKASSMFHLEKGETVFHLENANSASHRFIVRLFDDKGRKIKTLVNELGDFEGSKTFDVEREGDFLLNINSGGVWTVFIEQ